MSSFSSNRFIHGTALNNSCLRISTIWSLTISSFSTARVDSSTASVFFVSLETPTPLPTRTSTRTTKTPANTISIGNNISTLAFLIHFQHAFEHALREDDAGNAQPLQKLRTNLRRHKRAQHFAI